MKNDWLRLLLPALLAFVALAALYSFLPAGGQPAPQSSRSVSMRLAGAPFVEGGTATLHAVSSCGAFDVFLDGAKVGSPAAYFDFPIALFAGNHTLVAEGAAGCRSTLAFEVLARECGANQTQLCDDGGCGGVRRCEGGIYGACEPLKRVCVPGEKVGCSTDGCRFGHMACNRCGTGFGNCTLSCTAKDGNASCEKQ